MIYSKMSWKKNIFIGISILILILLAIIVYNRLLMTYNENLKLKGYSDLDGGNIQVDKHLLSKENNYNSGMITRTGDSGPGTGKVRIEGFEFAYGNCKNLGGKETWKKEFAGCSSELLKKEICCREVINPNVNFTVYFLSWTSGPEQECIGDCEENDYKTAFLKY